MIISAQMTKNYPKLSKWICENLPKVKNNAKIYKAFLLYSELNKTVGSASLTLGNAPTIDYRFMPGSNGEFEGSTFKDTVFISNEICEKFEKSAKDAKDKRMHILIEFTILHEMVHWGDFKDGIDQPGEEGKKFEKAAYGKDINRYW